MFVSNTKNANVSDLTYDEFSHLITILTQVMAVGRISLAKLLISVLIVSKEGLGHTKFESSGGLELPWVGVGQSCKAPYQ